MWTSTSKDFDIEVPEQWAHSISKFKNFDFEVVLDIEVVFDIEKTSISKLNFDFEVWNFDIRVARIQVMVAARWRPPGASRSAWAIMQPDTVTEWRLGSDDDPQKHY